MSTFDWSTFWCFMGFLGIIIAYSFTIYPLAIIMDEYFQELKNKKTKKVKKDLQIQNQSANITASAKADSTIATGQEAEEETWMIFTWADGSEASRFRIK